MPHVSRSIRTLNNKVPPTVSSVQGNPVPPQVAAPGNSNGGGECLGTIDVSPILEATGKLERVVPESQLMALINLVVSERTRESAERLQKKFLDLQYNSM